MSVSRGDHWNSPRKILDPVRVFWPWGIDLDPCANLGSEVGASVQVFAPLGSPGAPTDEGITDKAPEQAIRYGAGGWSPSRGTMFHRDGLARDWIGIVDAAPPITAYVNPPFSKPGPFVERCYDYGIAGMVESILVVPVSTSTLWWRRHVRTAAARVELDARVSFLDDGQPVKGNRYDSVVVYYGRDLWRFREVFRQLGKVIE